METIRI